MSSSHIANCFSRAPRQYLSNRTKYPALDLYICWGKVSRFRAGYRYCSLQREEKGQEFIISVMTSVDCLASG